MRVYCTACGKPQEAGGPGPRVCGDCGSSFVAPAVGPTAAAPKPPAKKGGMPAWAIVLLVLGGLAVPCVGGMAAIAIPNFIRFQARAKQTEAKAQLKSLYLAQRSHFSEHQAYATTLGPLGSSPDRGNRFAYFLAAQGPLEERSGPQGAPNPEAVGVEVDTHLHPKARRIRAKDLPPLAGGVPLGVFGECPDCEVTLVAAGNIDGDDTLDVWSISSAERQDPDGLTIAPGVPFNEVSDLRD